MNALILTSFRIVLESVFPNPFLVELYFFVVFLVARELALLWVSRRSLVSCFFTQLMLEIDVHSVVFAFKNSRLIFLSEMLMTLILPVNRLVLRLVLILAFKVTKVAALIVLILLALLNEGTYFFIDRVVERFSDNTIHFRSLFVTSFFSIPRRE